MVKNMPNSSNFVQSNTYIWYILLGRQYVQTNLVTAGPLLSYNGEVVQHLRWWLFMLNSDRFILRDLVMRGVSCSALPLYITGEVGASFTKASIISC